MGRTQLPGQLPSSKHWPAGMQSAWAGHTALSVACPSSRLNVHQASRGQRPHPSMGSAWVINHLLPVAGLRGHTHIRAGARVPLRGPSGGGRDWSVLSGSI